MRDSCPPMTIQEGGEDAIFVKEPVESCTPPVDSSSSSKPWKGMTPNSEVTTQLSTGRPCDSAGQSFCDGVLWDREDLVKAVRDEQLQCRADVATLQARCSSLERQLQTRIPGEAAARCRRQDRPLCSGVPRAHARGGLSRPAHMLGRRFGVFRLRACAFRHVSSRCRRCCAPERATDAGGSADAGFACALQQG